MPQLSLYLDEPTMESLRRDAAQAGTSLSKYVVGVLHEHAEAPRWPDGFFELYGSCDDEAFVEPPDSPFDDEPVEALD